MSDASGLRMEVSESDDISICVSPGPSIDNMQCPAKFLQHFPSVNLEPKWDEPGLHYSNNKSSLIDNKSSLIEYKKRSYLEVEKHINEQYYDLSDYYSSAMDILACYVKGNIYGI